MTSADGFFGGGAKSMSFGKMHDQTWLNRWRGGRVTHVGVPVQQTHIQTGAPEFNRDGSPKMHLPIVLACDGSGQNPQTNERTDPSDDGRRTLYVKGTTKFAIGKALQEHGLQLPEIGGELYLRWVGMKNVGEFDGRDWQVVYIPAPKGHNAAAAGFMSEGTPTPQAPPAAPPAQQPSAAGSGQFRPDDNGWQQPQAPVPAFSGAPAPQVPQADPWGAAPAQQPQAPQNVAPPAAPNDPWA